MFVAYRHNKSDLFGASEHAGRYVRTVRMVAKIFRKLFLVTISCLDARIDCYVRNCTPPANSPLFTEE